jgi:site-specific DNA-adenine methylase
MRPFFKHFGGKWRLSGKVPPPEHDTIIEPFAGGAGYSVRYGAGKRVILIDADADTVSIWRWLIAASEADVLALPVDEVAVKVEIRGLGLDHEPVLLIQRWLTPSGSRSTWSRPPSGVYDPGSRVGPGSLWTDTTKRRIASQLHQIRDWQVIHGDYRDAPDIAATWHIDPPYIDNKTGHSEYGTPMLDYQELGAWCKTRRGQVMVHEQHGAEWLQFETLNAKAQTSGQKKNGKAKRAHEVWWRNEMPAQADLLVVPR